MLRNMQKNSRNIKWRFVSIHSVFQIVPYGYIFMISDILCPKINKRRILHHVDLTYMGKFHVRNVIESLDFQYLRVVVLKDVAPCGGLSLISFIENRFSPYIFI